MAIASTPTLLSLDEFAQLMEISPWAMNQLDINYLIDIPRSCSVWYQYEWQERETLSREVVARAIADAEAIIAEQLTYWPAPRFTFGEEVPYPRPRQQEWWNTWMNQRWKLKDIKTKYGYWISPGIEAYTELDDDVAVTLSDTDGDGNDDWFTSDPVTTTLTDASEIEAYFRDSDRPASMVTGEEQRWRIRPVEITLDTVADTVVISGPIWLLVDPVLTITPNPDALDPTVAANYVTGIKVQRRYVDQTDQGEVVLEQIPCYSPSCVTIEASACYGERNSKQGIVTPNATDSNSWLGPACDCYYPDYYFAPDFCRVNYRSGYPLQTDKYYRMDHLHAQMVARLAACLLPEKSCVECSDTLLDYWRGYPFEGPEGSERLVLSNGDVGSPLGQRRGAIWTWKRCLELNERKVAGAIL